MPIFLIIIAFFANNAVYAINQIPSANIRVPLKTWIEKEKKAVIPALSSIDIYGGKAFVRESDSSDEDFWGGYERYGDTGTDYLENDVTRGWLTKKVEGLLPEQGEILDLMSGAFSFVEKKDGRRVHGIGLTENALRINERKGVLDSWEVLDINKNPYIKSDKKFDAVIISFGMNYLVRPIEVLSSVYELLKPEGIVIIICCTNHQDNKKVPDIWMRYYDDEYSFKSRLELTMDYLRKTRVFDPEVIMDYENTADYIFDFFGFMVIGRKIVPTNNEPQDIKPDDPIAIQSSI